MEYYHDQFQKLANLGTLDKSKLATMEDRILMQSARPQLYGTQFVGGSRSSDGEINTMGKLWGFHPIYDIVNVNKRRKSVGLVPIEEIAKEKGFKFNINEDE